MTNDCPEAYWWSYNAFADKVRNSYRHIMDENQQQFLDFVRRTHISRKATVPQGTVLWRAVLEHRMQEVPGMELLGFSGIPIPAKIERMKPLADRSTEGRVNSKGIPCLYCSNDTKTAMSEVRPWVGSFVTLGEFRTDRELVLVDCALNTHPYTPESVLSERGSEAEAWWTIDQAFSTPVSRNDDRADYAPTQIISEILKSAGCDGVIYGSRLGKGRTYALFDIDAAKLVGRQVCRVTNASFEFGPLTPTLVDDSVLPMNGLHTLG